MLKIRTTPEGNTVQVLQARERHNFGVKWVMQGLVAGWLAIERGRILLHQPNGLPDVRYRITRWPGKQIVDGRVVVLNHYECSLEVR